MPSVPAHGSITPTTGEASAIRILRSGSSIGRIRLAMRRRGMHSGDVVQAERQAWGSQGSVPPPAAEILPNASRANAAGSRNLQGNLAGASRPNAGGSGSNLQGRQANTSTAQCGWRGQCASQAAERPAAERRTRCPSVQRCRQWRGDARSVGAGSCQPRGHGSRWRRVAAQAVAVRAAARAGGEPEEDVADAIAIFQILARRHSARAAAACRRPARRHTGAVRLAGRGNGLIGRGRACPRCDATAQSVRAKPACGMSARATRSPTRRSAKNSSRRMTPSMRST